MRVYALFLSLAMSGCTISQPSLVVKSARSTELSWAKPQKYVPFDVLLRRCVSHEVWEFEVRNYAHSFECVFRFPDESGDACINRMKRGKRPRRGRYRMIRYCPAGGYRGMATFAVLAIWTGVIWEPRAVLTTTPSEKLLRLLVDYDRRLRHRFLGVDVESSRMRHVPLASRFACILALDERVQHDVGRIRTYYQRTAFSRDDIRWLIVHVYWRVPVPQRC